MEAAAVASGGAVHVPGGAVGGGGGGYDDPFRVRGAWPELDEGARRILSAVWSTRLASGRHRRRPFQSDLTQDEQQLVMQQLAPSLAAPLSRAGQERLRRAAAGEAPRRLALADKAALAVGRVGLRWAQGVDLLDRANGTLPTAIKMYVDARRCGGLKNFASFAGLDSAKVEALPLDARERALLDEVVREARSSGAPRTVLVLIFVLVGNTQWPHQGYEPHVTKLVVGLPGDTARYEDHAMSAAERRADEARFAWQRGRGRKPREVFVEPSAEAVREGRKLARRPAWLASEAAECTRLRLSGRFPHRVLEVLTADLQANYGVRLEHEQAHALQSFGTPQCALAMLFDLHVGVADGQRQRVCEAFRAHPDCERLTQCKARAAEKRWGHNTLLHLYEQWVHGAHRAAFAAARLWRDTNSLKIGDLLSSGVCDACDLFDSPGALLLCAEEGCPGAVHTFCLARPPQAGAPDWRCSRHARAGAVASDQ